MIPLIPSECILSIIEPTINPTTRWRRYAPVDGNVLDRVKSVRVKFRSQFPWLTIEAVNSMSVELFRQRLSRSQVHPNDIKWMPKWLKEFACQQADPTAGMFTFDTGIVTRFLQSLRDRGAPAWQIVESNTPVGGWCGHSKGLY